MPDGNFSSTLVLCYEPINGKLQWWFLLQTQKRWCECLFRFVNEIDAGMIFLILSHLTNRKKPKGDFQSTWQPPIIGSFYDGAKLPLKEGSQGREGSNEGCVLDVGRELFVQTAIRLHCWGHIAVIYLNLVTVPIQLEEMLNVLWKELEQNSTSWSRVSSYHLNLQSSNCLWRSFEFI